MAPCWSALVAEYGFNLLHDFLPQHLLIDPEAIRKDRIGLAIDVPLHIQGASQAPDRQHNHSIPLSLER